MYFSPIMQRNCFYGTGPQNTVPYLPFQPPLQNNVHSPEIIGEGDVTSVVLPNGSVQYFFIPTLKRDVWTPYAYTPATMNVNWNLASQAWFVRNISNPIAPSFCLGQQYLRPYGDPFNTNVMVSDCNPNTPALGYNNMFHYDISTSTTDLHYFYPSLCRSNQQQTSASVQIDTAASRPTICVYELVCGKPCPCGVASGNTKYCQDESVRQLERVSSAMSIEGVDLKSNCECPPPLQSLDKSVITLRDSCSDEDSEELTVKDRNKIRESNKIQSSGKEKGTVPNKPLEKSPKEVKKTPLSDVHKKDTSNKNEPFYKKRTSNQKLNKGFGEDSSNSDKEKVPDDATKDKEVKSEKKNVTCQCDDKIAKKSNNNEEKGKSCNCSRKRYKGSAASASHTDKLSLIEIIGHCDGNCCCNHCGAGAHKDT